MVGQITDLPDTIALALDDLIEVTKNPSTTPVSESTTLQKIKDLIDGNGEYQIESHFNDAPGASATEYYAIASNHTGNNGEIQRQSPIGQDVTVTSITVQCRINNKGNSHTFALRDDTTSVITATILAGSTAIFTQVTTANIAGGSLICYESAPGTDTSNTVTYYGASMQRSDD